MGIKVAEVLDFVRESGDRTNIVTLKEKFDLSNAAANKLMATLYDKGLLVPFRTSYFTFPDENGLAPEFVKKANPAWYAAQREAVMGLIDPDKPVALAIKDVVERLDFSNRVAAAVLAEMVKMGMLNEQESRYGGIFGHKPRLFGTTDNSFLRREAVYKKKEKKPAAKPANDE